MKKIIFGLFAFVCLFALIGCTGPDEPPVITPPVEDETTLEEYQAEVKEFLDKTIPSEVTENVELPDYYDYEDGASAFFEWSSSNGRTLSSKGKFRANLFDEEITMAAVVSFSDPYGKETTFNYEKKVITKGSEDLEAYKKIIEGYLPDYVYQDFELVEKDATFRGKNAFGMITYKSGSEDVITSDGKYVNQNVEDIDVEFFYTVEINGIIINGSKIIKAEGKKYEYYTQQAVKFLDDYFKDMVSFEETEKFASGPIVEEHRENLIKFYTKEGINTVGNVEILDINDCIQFYFIDDAEGQFNSAIATYGTFQHGMLINISKFNKIMGSLYCWTPLNSEYEESKFCDKAYILAISNTDFVNIAYAIIEVSQDRVKQNVYYAKTIESVFFPKIDGKYQNITDEYILDKFQNFLNSTKGEN